MSLTTRQVARMAGVHRDTLLRWLREQRIPEPERDRNGWRVFTPEDAEAVVRYAKGSETSKPSALHRLAQLDWDFADANTGYLTHNVHPYPAKFIPQIPNALIQELSSVGDTIVDPFCGSGTTLVEALLLKRHAVGVDASPLACLISRAKTSRLTATEVEQLRDLEDRASRLAFHQADGTLPLFPRLDSTPEVRIPNAVHEMQEWFDSHVIEELAMLRTMCVDLPSGTARDIALTAFSSIVVGVSRQDSDTRYVRRDKDIGLGDTCNRFVGALRTAVERAIEFAELVEPRFTNRVIQADVLDNPDIGQVDLVVCSPPYPNAYSYHLYHRSRMLWLGMDQPGFKRVEIGSHRKYSSKSKNAATVETFRRQLRSILRWLHGHLRSRGYACFVIGDSIIKGEAIKNNEVLKEVAQETGYLVEESFDRRLQDSKKYFNPAIGKIKVEHIVVLRRTE